jgi:hypothetical protein
MSELISVSADRLEKPRGPARGISFEFCRFPGDIPFGWRIFWAQFRAAPRSEGTQLRPAPPSSCPPGPILKVDHPIGVCERERRARKDPATWLFEFRRYSDNARADRALCGISRRVRACSTQINIAFNVSVGTSSPPQVAPA